jgi:CTP:molybdopterin cytidylyltransferase MocA
LWESFAAYPNLDAVILLTRDQPLVDREIIIGLNTKREEAKKPIIASRCASTLGIPALFDRAYFDELFSWTMKPARKVSSSIRAPMSLNIRLSMAQSTSTRRSPHSFASQFRCAPASACSIL